MVYSFSPLPLLQEENRGIKDAEGYKIRQEKKRKVEEEADKRGHVSQDTAMRVGILWIKTS